MITIGENVVACGRLASGRITVLAWASGVEGMSRGLMQLWYLVSTLRFSLSWPALR
jgi:hypothetical protein